MVFFKDFSYIFKYFAITLFKYQEHLFFQNACLPLHVVISFHLILIFHLIEFRANDLETARRVTSNSVLAKPNSVTSNSSSLVAGNYLIFDSLLNI